MHLHDAVLTAVKNNLFLGKASYQKTLCVYTTRWNGMMIFMWNCLAVFKSNMPLLKDGQYFEGDPFFSPLLDPTLLCLQISWALMVCIESPSMCVWLNCFVKLHPGRLSFSWESDQEKCFPIWKCWSCGLLLGQGAVFL